VSSPLILYDNDLVPANASYKTGFALRREMLIIAMILCVAVLVASVLMKRARDRDLLERHSITSEHLHRLLAAHDDLAIFDVRHPLDLLANSVVIPGARRVAPEEVMANPALIPRERDTVVYCTCPSDNTSRVVLRRALARGFLRTKFLKGGLEAWQAKGYPVERYDQTFHLSSTDAAPSR
jgi:rhodanese-related sulfurtransferase